MIGASLQSKEYVDAHPADIDGTQGAVGVQAHFAKPGLYKGWGQFRRDGRVHTVPIVAAIQ